jgi:hypothetical protein
LLAGLACNGPKDKAGHMKMLPREMGGGSVADVEELGTLALAKNGNITSAERQRIISVFKLPRPPVEPASPAASSGASAIGS